MLIKIEHRGGFASAIDTYIITDVASFNVFTLLRRGSRHRIACVSAAKGRVEQRDIERFSDAEWDCEFQGGTPYEFIRSFWAKCLAERYAGVTP